jgi:hypothetical protein
MAHAVSTPPLPRTQTGMAVVKRTSIHFAFARMVSRLCWSTSAYLLVSLPLKKASVSSASFSDASWPNAAYVHLVSDGRADIWRHCTHPDDVGEREVAFVALHELSIVVVNILQFLRIAKGINTHRIIVLLEELGDDTTGLHIARNTVEE